MSKKYKELISLDFYGGSYHATIYNKIDGCFEDKTFIFYNKKDVISILRKKHGVIVSNDFQRKV